MKKIIYVIWLFCFPNNLYSQDTINDNNKRQFLNDSQVKLTPSEIISNFRSVDELGWLSLFTFVEPTPFENANKLNVFNYFHLNETYDSNLKKEVFKKTTDYNNLLDSLKKIKSSYLNSIYYQTGFNISGGETFDMEFNNDGQKYQVNYDIQKKGFNIGIGKVLPYLCSSGFSPKVIELVEFKQLTISKKYNLNSNSDKSYTQYIFIPMDEYIALEIENNRSEIEILRVFNILGSYNATFKDQDFLSDYNGKTCKTEVMIGGNMRLLVYNKLTDKIYFDKIYKKLN